MPSVFHAGSPLSDMLRTLCLQYATLNQLFRYAQHIKPSVCHARSPLLDILRQIIPLAFHARSPVSDILRTLRLQYATLDQLRQIC